MAINDTAPDLAVELQNGGIEVRLGDDMNGYLAEETVRTVAEIAPWLQEAILTSTRSRPTRARSARNSRTAPSSDSSSRRRSACR